MKYKAVIFDLDGTLLNTIDDLADSANRVLSSLCFPTHETEKYKYFVGNGIPKLIERCLPPDKQEYKEKALQLFIKDYELHSRDKTAPYPGINELLKALSDMGISMGVITNKAHSIAGEVVEYFMGKNIFCYVRGLDETIKAKPDPNGALSVAERLLVKPCDVLYVGDSGVDMQTALNAGFTPCGVTWGFRKEDELKENGAVYIVHTPGEIVSIVKGE